MKELILTSFDIESLTEILADKIAARIGSTSKHEGPERLYTKSEAAAYLSVHENTLDNYRRGGSLNWVNIGNQIRFKESDLKNLINSGTV